MSELEGKSADSYLFDAHLAHERIHEKHRDYYGISSVEDLILTEADFQLAEQVCQQEHDIIYAGGGSLTREGLFRGISYCLLTPMQQYSGQSRAYDSIFGTTTPDNGFEQEKITNILKHSGILFHAQKAKYISKAWDSIQETEVFPIIQDHLSFRDSDRECDVVLRDIVSDEFTGLGLKTSSLLLRMCGTENLIPIDSWMVEILHLHGYPCTMPRSRVERERWETKDRSYLKLQKRALPVKEYLLAEEYAADLAHKYGVPGYLLQMAYWARNSSYRKQIK